MSNNQGRTHWGKKVVLIGSLAGLFLVSVAVEPPAEESCCPEGEDALSYYIKTTPERWDPAPWGATLNPPMIVKLLDKNDTPVAAQFGLEAPSVHDAAGWNGTVAADQLSMTVTMTIKKMQDLTFSFACLAALIKDANKGKSNDTQWLTLVHAIKERNIPFALSCMESRSGTFHIRLFAQRDNKKFLGVFSFRPPIEAVPAPVF